MFQSLSTHVPKSKTGNCARLSDMIQNHSLYSAKSSKLQKQSPNLPTKEYQYPERKNHLIPPIKIKPISSNIQNKLKQNKTVFFNVRSAQMIESTIIENQERNKERQCLVQKDSTSNLDKKNCKIKPIFIRNSKTARQNNQPAPIIKRKLAQAIQSKPNAKLNGINKAIQKIQLTIRQRKLQSKRKQDYDQCQNINPSVDNWDRANEKDNTQNLRCSYESLFNLDLFPQKPKCAYYDTKKQTNSNNNQQSQLPFGLNNQQNSTQESIFSPFEDNIFNIK